MTFSSPTTIFHINVARSTCARNPLRTRSLSGGFDGNNRYEALITIKTLRNLKCLAATICCEDTALLGDSFDGSLKTARSNYPELSTDRWHVAHCQLYHTVVRKQSVHARGWYNALKDSLPRKAKLFRRCFRVPFLFSGEIVQVKYNKQLIGEGFV